MKIKTESLIGPALNWAVAKCQGRDAVQVKANGPVHLMRELGCDPAPFEPSTNPSQSWPIIERIGGLLTKSWLESTSPSRYEVRINNYDGDWVAFGPTLLIAIMRCYVASVLGDEIEVPDELLLD